MCFYCIGMRINFFSKVTRVHEATKDANDTNLCFTILVLSLEFHSSRLGWNIPYEQTTEFVPVTEPAWYRAHMKRPFMEACAWSLFTRTRKQGWIYLLFVCCRWDEWKRKPIRSPLNRKSNDKNSLYWTQNNNKGKSSDDFIDIILVRIKFITKTCTYYNGF